MQHLSADKDNPKHPIAFKISYRKPVAMFFVWVFFSLFLGLMSFDLAWSYISNFAETHEKFSLLVAVIGVFLPYGYLTFITFRAASCLFTGPSIVMDTEGIQISTNRKTRSWGKIPWKEIEDIYVHSISGFVTGFFGTNNLIIYLKPSSSLVGTQKITLLQTKYRLQCSISLFADINTLRQTAKTYLHNSR